MQPLAYLAIRGLLGWLQFIERRNRAFLSNPLLLVAAGAAHCWAVVYALFVAIHTRAMRFDGYHEGYTEHLPFSVAWTEMLATASLSIWWIAGFTTAAVRILDDDATDLPMELNDTKASTITRIIRSPALHSGLAVAHTVSCAGLFVSILLLCITMAAMSGSITVCELCLVVVSVGFALPHAVIATRRLGSQSLGDALPAHSVEAAASEAAAIGPQLCVILALADSPGHAYIWQNLVYLAASVSFVVAVAASGQSPPKGSGDALPPEPMETWTCLALDFAACACLLLCFPHLNTIYVWLLAALLLALAVSVHFPEWRDFYVDLLEPLFVVRSDTHKRLPGATRQLLRKNCWFIGLVCATVAVWDICLHPIQEGLLFAPTSSRHVHAHDKGAHLLFKWKSTLEHAPDNVKMLTSAASVLEVSPSDLYMEVTLPEHRLGVFKYTGLPRNNTMIPLSTYWKVSLLSPEGELGELVNSSFPSDLNVTKCGSVRDVIEKGNTTDDSEEVKEMTADADMRSAYLAACEWWKKAVIDYTSESAAR